MLENLSLVTEQQEIGMSDADANWSADEIIKTINDMQDHIAGNYHPELIQSFSKFEARYPGLHSKASKKMTKLDWDILQKMLEQLKKIENKEINSYDSSVCIGQDLVDRFVIPNLEPQNHSAQ